MEQMKDEIERLQDIARNDLEEEIEPIQRMVDEIFTVSKSVAKLYSSVLCERIVSRCNYLNDIKQRRNSK